MPTEPKKRLTKEDRAYAELEELQDAQQHLKRTGTAMLICLNEVVTRIAPQAKKMGVRLRNREVVGLVNTFFFEMKGRTDLAKLPMYHPTLEPVEGFIPLHPREPVAEKEPEKAKVDAKETAEVFSEESSPF